MTTRRYGIHPPQLVGRMRPPLPNEDPVVALRRMQGELEEGLQELQRFLKYLQDANDTSQSGAGITGITGGVMDHGALSGLLDDDHPQYLKEKGQGGLASEIPIHDHHDNSEAGKVDHGTLNGLADDDHPQYLNESRHEALDSLRRRHPLPHTHVAEEVIGAATGATVDEGRIALHRHPHTHEGADLIGAVTVETVGTPGSPLSLGDFILASQIFGP